MKLGQKARCKVTGFEGVLSARAEHLNGCIRWSIQPRVKADGSLPDSYWFDEVNIDVIEEKPQVEHKTVGTGGPIEKVARE